MEPNLILRSRQRLDFDQILTVRTPFSPAPGQYAAGENGFERDPPAKICCEGRCAMVLDSLAISTVVDLDNYRW
jgi:hypothetical protein